LTVKILLSLGRLKALDRHQQQRRSQRPIRLVIVRMTMIAEPQKANKIQQEEPP
jgi:hypothetical protein